MTTLDDLDRRVCVLELRQKWVAMVMKSPNKGFAEALREEIWGCSPLVSGVAVVEGQAPARGPVTATVSVRVEKHVDAVQKAMTKLFVPSLSTTTFTFSVVAERES